MGRSFVDWKDVAIIDLCDAPRGLLKKGKTINLFGELLQQHQNIP